ncbi:hypothetical protein [Arcticibacterium luteifluviistationis]|uniref:Uncharacterized protein n=1 Tax=Arcticibacterium luteifluviistationis TaxID=1784714 RepID=A0A2Z4GBP1_9BACT|nr:hypothetical protein [Arcticibacterium luteifluviistationis]AWV98475.1 hypothetical protein DJ013_09945 [Arcticibacterium luteifluviistationis]
MITLLENPFSTEPAQLEKEPELKPLNYTEVQLWKKPSIKQDSFLENRYTPYTSFVPEISTNDYSRPSVSSRPDEYEEESSNSLWWIIGGLVLIAIGYYWWERYFDKSPE